MTENEMLIHFWEVKLREDTFLLEPTTVYVIQQTVRALKELEALKTRELAERIRAGGKKA